MAGADDTCATFQFHEEGHTLGNVLRYMLIKNPDVDFAAYTCPHPSEDLMNLRLQTNGKPCAEAMDEALGNIIDVCKHVRKTFRKAVADIQKDTDTEMKQ
eukprot:GDKI01021749.1.p2 GENE.GDKI01021749.1~~GDKI01021749.1.p2  ORF type:complete len:100 (-),score=24.80 GDKI01021749.1:35-334(-)